MSNRPIFAAGPSREPFAVTPSDSTNFTRYVSYFYVGGAGNMVLVKDDGTTVTYSNIPAGQYIWAGGRRVNSTNTTATNIVAHP